MVIYFSYALALQVHEGCSSPKC